MSDDSAYDEDDWYDDEDDDRWPRFVPRPRTIILWVVLILIAGLGWIAVTAVLAKSDTDSLRLELTTMKNDLTHGNDAQAAQLEADMQRQSSAAHARTSGPAWWVAAHIPYVRGPVGTVRGAASIVNDLAHTSLPAAVQAGQLLDPHALRTGPDQINLTRLSKAQAPLSTATASTDDLMQRADKLSGSTWISKVNSSRNELVKDIATLHSSLADLSTAAKLMPTALGQTGTKRYFVAFQTDAEPRGLGGLVGSYAIMQATDGRLQFLKFGSDNDLLTARANVNLGADYNNQFLHYYGGPAQSPERSFRNSNPSPNFPYAAQIWVSMWENEFHQHLDGAIATDPTALGYLLGAAGSVSLSDGTIISASNAVAFFEHDEYVKFKGNEQNARKTFQNAAAQAVATKVLNEPSSALLNSAKAMQRATDESHLMVYSTDPTIENAIQDDPVSGVLPETPNPFLDVVINNVAANKIGYYLTRTVTYHRTTCAATTVTVSMTIKNSAPKRGLPSYITGSYTNIKGLAGATKLLVSLYGTDGSTASEVTVDGLKRTFATYTQRGHPVFVASRFIIDPGQTRHVVFTIHEPAAKGPLLALQQPGVTPLKQTISAPTCTSSS